jgi:cell division protein FtsB
MFKKIKPHLNLNNAVLVVALLITANWVWGTVDAIQRNFVLQQQVDSLAQQNEFQSLQNETLAFEQKYYNTQEYLELSAREHLNKTAPGEKVLILPPNTVSSKNVGQPAAGTTIPLSKRSNFEQWMYFLFGNKKQ